MNKKLFAVFLAVLSLSILIVVVVPSEIPTNRNRSEEEILQEIDNASSVYAAVTMEYDESFAQWLCDFNVDLTLSGMNYAPTLQQLDNSHPIELLRTVEVSDHLTGKEQKIYAVYRIKGGGRLFAFFRFVNQKEYWMEFAVYCKQAMSAADFAKLEEGKATAEDVRRIDPATYLWDGAGGGRYSIHLAREGMVAINYLNGKVDRIAGISIGRYDPYYDLRLCAFTTPIILPQDMP